MVYALGSWLPKLMNKAGYELGSSLSFLLVLNFGAIFGAIGGGWLADRFHLRRVLTIMFAIAALSISALAIKNDMIVRTRWWRSPVRPRSARRSCSTPMSRSTIRWRSAPPASAGPRASGAWGRFPPMLAVR